MLACVCWLFSVILYCKCFSNIEIMYLVFKAERKIQNISQYSTQIKYHNEQNSFLSIRQKDHMFKEVNEIRNKRIAKHMSQDTDHIEGISHCSQVNVVVFSH